MFSGFSIAKESGVHAAEPNWQSRKIVRDEKIKVNTHGV